MRNAEFGMRNYTLSGVPAKCFLWGGFKGGLIAAIGGNGEFLILLLPLFSFSYKLEL